MAFSCEQLLALHEQLKCDGLDKPQIFPKDLQHCLSRFDYSQRFSRKEIGQSYNGTPIELIRMGDGPISIFCWSQMHGDEPTATASILDIIALLVNDNYEQESQTLLQRVTLYLLPMLNPDGADLVCRENLQGIDINRDASALQTPEGKILHNLLNELKPDFAFNLHDQSRYYGVEDTGSNVAMAFMAPPPNKAEAVTESRLKAMQLIGKLVTDFAPQTKGRVTRYLDPYSAMAFGDYAASIGIPTVLIESCELISDPNRQLSRAFNFAFLIHSFTDIANWNSQNMMGLEDTYLSLPGNIEDGVVDVLIKNVSVNEKRVSHKLDIGLTLCKKIKLNTINKLGDLNGVGGHVVFNANGAVYEQGNVYIVEHPIDLTDDMYRSILSQGYCRFSGDISLINQLSSWPIVKSPGQDHPSSFARLNQAPSFLIRLDGQVIAALLNGNILIF